MLMACLKFFSKCPCPRCLILKEDIHKLGTRSDWKTRDEAQRHDDRAVRYSIKRARELIYKKGYAVNSSRIDGVLGNSSLVPTRVSS